MKKLIVIAGPTASGKTSLAVALAKELNCDILSADSRQFYKEISIGTAKPTKEEMGGVTHHFIDSHSLTTPLSAVGFEKEALQVLSKCYETNDYAILVGGSGMFIKALLEGTDELPHDKKVQEKWNKTYAEKGIDYLKEQVNKKDPITYNTIDKNNPVRLIRALEIMDLTQRSYSELVTGTKKQRPFTSYYFVLNHPREVLYNRINQRVDQMIEKGLVEEVQSVAHLKNLQTLNTVGYKEIFDYLDGKTTLEEAIALIKQNTRRYAKRQLTWFRKVEGALEETYDTLFQSVIRLFQS